MLGLGQQSEDLELVSPKSRDFSRSNNSDQSHNLDEDQANALAIEERAIQASSNLKPLTLDKSEINKDNLEKNEDNLASPSSSFINTSDDEVKPVENHHIYKSPTKPHQHTKTIKSSLPKRKQEQKRPWSHLEKGVLNIWQAIKLAIQRGLSAEQLRQNKNTAGSWKPVLDAEYEHRKLFLAFLASE